jgi:hypothetical protein
MVETTVAHDYCFEELGPRAFEQLTAALASATFGAVVEVYGSGKDGGREATFEGTVKWGAAGNPSWTGYVVVQAKQKEHISSPAENLLWLQQQIRAEFDRWMTPDSTGRRFPQYLLFVTNARLSAAQNGGVDEIQNYINAELTRIHDTNRSDQTLSDRGLRDVKVWHRDVLNAMISQHQSIRAAFPALLTVGDVLTLLQALPGSINVEALAPVLHEHAISTLRNDRWVRFSEAGGPDRRSVERVIVDVPARVDDARRVPVFDECFQRANLILRRSVFHAGTPRHLVITGAAGNGKSTLATYLTQVYRTSFLSNDVDLPDPITEIIDDTNTSLHRLNLTAPTNRRWPVNISLPEMAADMGPSGGPNLLRWLASKVSDRAAIDVIPTSLRDWLRAWPCVLFLDGFDEVTAPSLRERVIDEITELVDMADNLDADLFVVVTTRPTGYTERILPTHFDQIDLDYLMLDEALTYGRHVTSERLHDDASLREQLLERFEQSAIAGSTERLLKTPLQVLILTFILETFGDLPANRYGLFSKYYEIMYQREAAKPTTYRPFFRDHYDDITELHERVGLVLQVHLESADETRARLPLTVLRRLTTERMKEIGHDDIREVETLTQQIIDIATKRLVLLAADEDDTVSFDVRSLQELMAARALTKGDDDIIRHNLVLTARSPHWRNTWLFAAGKLFTEDDHRRNLVTAVVEQFDGDEENGWPGWLYPVGPELAAHLIDDGLAATKPLFQKTFVKVALRCLDGPVPEEFSAIGQALSYAADSKALNTLIRNDLKTAFAGTPTAVAVASILVAEAAFNTVVPGQPSEKRMLHHVAHWSAPIKEGPAVTVGQMLRELFQDLGDLPGASLLEAALAECDDLTLRRTQDGGLRPGPATFVHGVSHLSAVLADREATELLQLCLGSIEPAHWLARSVLARAVWSAWSRQPIGDQLQMPYLRPDCWE